MGDDEVTKKQKAKDREQKSKHLAAMERMYAKAKADWKEARRRYQEIVALSGGK